MIKGVIFDMDGVLTDNMSVHNEVLEKFARKYGCADDADFSSFAGRGNDYIIPALLPAETVEKHGLQTLSDEKEQMYRDYYASFIEPTNGLMHFLEDLKRNGIKAAVGSSGTKANVDFVLSALDIKGMFQAIVSGDMVPKRKPDPEIFLRAAGRLGLEPADCIVIEDAMAGIQAARNAGMRVVALATTHTATELAEKGKPDLIAKDFTELSVEILREKLDR